MKMVKKLVTRGWIFEIYMSSDDFFHVNASHGAWGDATGASDDFNEAVDEMFETVKELEKA